MNSSTRPFALTGVALATVGALIATTPAAIGNAAVPTPEATPVAADIALLSHSNFGSSSQPSAVKMRQTLELLRIQAPWLEVDGEMHGDMALDGQGRASLMPNSTLSGDANLLVLPNIDAANISYNLLKTAAGGNIAIGPVLLGAAKPVQILTPSATVRRIVNMTALTVADANASR